MLEFAGKLVKAVQCWISLRQWLDEAALRQTIPPQNSLYRHRKRINKKGN
jgi:hypothetical protein